MVLNPVPGDQLLVAAPDRVNTVEDPEHTVVVPVRITQVEALVTLMVCCVESGPQEVLTFSFTRKFPVEE